jgi:cytochrome P450
LTWACYLLATHRNAQHRIAKEVSEATENGCLAPEHVSKLPWTTAVVKEALRLYPPIWSMGRKVSQDTFLAGQPLRRDTDVWICLYHLHRDERWFSEPDRFMPERWIEQPPPKPFTYLPFGIGPRVCIGQHFAIAEAILALASIVSRFGLTAPTGQIITPSAWITLRPKQPVMLQLSERETPSQHESLNRQKDKVADPLATSHSPSHL